MTPRESETLQHRAAATGAYTGTPAPDRLLEHAMAFWRSAVLLSAHDLGLFTALAAGPCEAGTLVRRLGLGPDATADLLDALVALDLVERGEGSYRNSREASLFLDPASPSYIGAWLAMASAAMRQMADLTCHLRGTGASEQGCPSLADRMWADIAGILQSSSE